MFADIVRLTTACIIIIIITIFNPSENAPKRSFSSDYLIVLEDGNSTSQIPLLVVRRNGLPMSYPR